MYCGRCSGYVVPEQISDPYGTTERHETVRCLNCGNIEDAMILTNRNHHVCRLSLQVPPPPVDVCSIDCRVDSAREVSQES